MHFIFGYLREVPVKIEKKTPKAVLVGIAILVALLFIFLSFEDIDGETISSYQSSQTSSSLVQSSGMDNFEIDSKIHPEQSFWIHSERFILKDV